MLKLQLINWLRWDSGSHAGHEELAYLWIRNLDAVLAKLPEDQPICAVHVDGTASIADNYLRARPGAGDRLSGLVRSGQVWTGPWYTPPAPILASGEALIRNLLLGTAQNQELGARPHTCLFFPSPIHISQMPQILSGFGISAAVMPLPATVGAPEETTALWTGSDGSRVLVLWLPQVEPTAELLGSARADHVETDARTQTAICYLGPRRQGPGSTFTDLATGPLQCGNHQVYLGSIERVVAALPSPQSAAAGELITTECLPGDNGTMMIGYASTWPHLRLALWDVQALLEQWTEPWSTAAWLHGEDYPACFLETAWKHVLLNHRRDARGGCVSDTVYHHMLVRIEQARHLGEVLLRDSLAAVAARPTPAPLQHDSSPDRSVPLWVVNPLAWPRNEVVTAQVDLPPETQHLELRSETGHVLPYQLHYAEMVAGPAGTSSRRNARRFTISFRAEALPATGFRCYQVAPSASRPYFMGESIAAGNTLENRYLRVTVRPNGALRIEDKRTGYTYDNCNVFEDGGDAGTPLMFAAPEQDRLITTYAAHAQVSIVENGLFVGTIQVQHELSLPAELHPYRNRRSESRTTCDITSYVTLRQESAQVEIHTRVMNRARDHRLRVLFSSGIPASKCYVAQPFDVVERATGMLDRGTVAPERQTLPKLEFVDINDGRHGLMVASRGLYEYEVKPTPAGTLALTLFRAIALTQNPEAESQALESLYFDYALIPHPGTWHRALRSAYGFCGLPRAFTSQDLGVNNVSPTGRSQAPTFGLVALEPAPLMLSSIKRSEDETGVIVRAYNPTEDLVQGQFTIGWPVSGAHLARMDETLVAPVECTDHQRITVAFAPHQIVTLHLTPLRRPSS